ncbi:MAG: hypothetical protein ACC742_07515 [Thermoanaerobaculales bacterium]
MKKASVIVIVALGSLLVGGAPRAQEFKVVVNDANPLTSVSAKQLSRIFLKRTGKWPSGVPAVPIDRAASTDVRKEFSTAVHGRDISAIRAYWQRMIFSVHAVPPIVMSSDNEILAAVRADPGAVGYVSGNTSIVDGVKVIEVTGIKQRNRATGGADQPDGAE